MATNVVVVQVKADEYWRREALMFVENGLQVITVYMDDQVTKAFRFKSEDTKAEDQTTTWMTRI
jgi:hypothetical protein